MKKQNNQKKSKKTNKLKAVINKISKQSNTDKKTEKKYLKIVVFTLDEEEYGIPITDLKEIIRIPEITHIPNSPKYIKGILNLRGQIIVVVNLEKLFKLTRSNDKNPNHILISDIDNNKFGLIVDNVTEIKDIKLQNIKKTPKILSAKIGTNNLKGVAVLDKKSKNSRIIMLLNLPKILSIDELVNMEKTIKKQTKTKI